MRHSRHISLSIIISAVVLLFVGCTRSNHCTSIDVEALEQRLEQGDLVFRRGTGVVGRIVTSVDTRGQFSHVGVAVIKDGVWHIIHAVPHEPDFEGDVDRVKCEPLASFVGRYESGAVGIYRVYISEEGREIAIHNAWRLSRENRAFDHEYDTDDTTKLYCTELVEHIYKLAGVSLSGGRRTRLSFPTLSGEYIMPSDMTDSELLTLIY